MPINVNNNNNISPNTNIVCINGGFTIPDTRCYARKHANGELNPGHTPLNGGVVVNCTTAAVVLKKSSKLIHCFAIYFKTTSIQFIIAISSLYLHDCGNKIRSYFVVFVTICICMLSVCIEVVLATSTEPQWRRSGVASRIVLL